MPGLPPKLVVTTYAPTRRMVTIVLLVLVVAAGVYGMFEFGRYRAGYDVVASLKHRAELSSEIDTQEDTIAELRAKVAQLESSTVGQTREREEVQRNIGDLQAEVARLNQDLAFYRGIVTQNANSAEVKIQQARMVATSTANKFRVRVTLVQPMKPDSVVSGVVILSVSESGFIEGTVEVTSIVMNGTVNGDMYARERLVLGGKARVNGNVHYGVIEMAPGAVITGKLIPLGDAKASQPAAAPAAESDPEAVATAKSRA